MDYKISDSEWPVMQVLWEHGPLTQPQLMQCLSREWNKNTVHTFLTRLQKKGLVDVVKTCTPHQYSAAVKREDCVYQEKQSFLNKVYQGSAGKLVSSFLQDGDLSAQEIADLRRLLDSMDDTAQR
ncbi:MAG: BlaI/MecI/CopY family transcriptional regulator [Peptococcaceae bacterium]|nr:BlaI/MecI/CopY family transcriptional regulator [Peptococcaceae bacterium]